MSHSINLREIEYQARRAAQADGLVRLFVGMWLALHGLFNIDHRHVWAPIIGVQALLWAIGPLRQRVTYPRIGYARFPPERTEVKVAAAIGFFVAYSMAGVLDYSSVSWLSPLYLGVFLAGIAFVWTLRYGTSLDYAFAGLCLVSGVVGLWFTLHGTDDGLVTAIQFWVLSAVLTPIGLAQLITFLTRYPLASEEPADVNL